MTRRDRLILYALGILSDAIDDCDRGSQAVPPSIALKFALGFLYAVGDRSNEWFDRQPYDDFLRVVTSPPGESPTPHMGIVIRFTKLHTCMKCIARASGVALLPEIDQQISQRTRTF